MTMSIWRASLIWTKCWSLWNRKLSDFLIWWDIRQHYRMYLTFFQLLSARCWRIADKQLFVIVCVQQGFPDHLAPSFWQELRARWQTFLAAWSCDMQIAQNGLIGNRARRCGFVEALSSIILCADDRYPKKASNFIQFFWYFWVCWRIYGVTRSLLRGYCDSLLTCLLTFHPISKLSSFWKMNWSAVIWWIFKRTLTASITHSEDCPWALRFMTASLQSLNASISSTEGAVRIWTKLEYSRE